jgi:hypothetical protein
MKKLMSVMLLTLTALGADAALAGATSPLTVGGTWTVVANRSRLVLRIHPHANASACTAITGILDGADPIHGFYCSSTGRIHFLRSDVSNQPTQSWLGSVSNDGPGAVQFRWQEPSWFRILRGAHLANTISLPSDKCLGRGLTGAPFQTQPVLPRLDRALARAWRSCHLAPSARSRFRRHTRRTTSTSSTSASPRGG